MTMVMECLGSDAPVTIDAGDLVGLAVSLMASARVSHLMVMERDSLLGVVCACDVDIASPATPIGELIRRTVITVGAHESLLDAAQRMQAHGVSCLPVIQAGVLRGVITWNDLSRLGVVPAHEERCIACGSTEHVRCRAHGELAGFCLECTRRSQPPAWNDDIGGPG